MLGWKMPDEILLRNAFMIKKKKKRLAIAGALWNFVPFKLYRSRIVLGRSQLMLEASSPVSFSLSRICAAVFPQKWELLFIRMNLNVFNAFKVKQMIDLIGYLNVVPNSNPLGIKCFVLCISISFKCECHLLMQMQHTKNFNPARFELGTTPS